MTMRAALLALPALLLAAPVALAHEGHVHTTNPLVDARMGGMTMMVATMAQVSRAAEGEGSIARAAFPASGLASFARAIPALFAPETATVEGSRALPAVWQDSAGFSAQAAEFAAATAALEAAARADDRDAFTAALARTKNACQACHTTYRAEP
jgi:cytochrome c556